MHPKAQSKSRLEYILADMISAANNRQHFPIKHMLRNGLYIEIISDPSSLSLYIYRHDGPPSDLEMRTVLKHFPYKIGETRYRETLYKNRNALVADIPHDKQLKFA